jgi:hypothetical protein
LFACATAPTQRATLPSGHLVGVVHDENGAPVALAKVLVESPSLKQPLAQVTDESGAFALEGLPDGEYNLTFTFGERTIRREHVQVSEKWSPTVTAQFDAPAPARD